MSEREALFQFRENTQIAFAIFCDENALTVEQGVELAREIGYQLELTAEDREAYLSV